MRELGEPIKAKKPARPFDGVDQPEDGVEHLGIVGLLLETHELNVELIEPSPVSVTNSAKSSSITPTLARADKTRAAAPRLCRGLSVNSGLRFVDHRNDFAWAGRF
jgi:hypothetical protein